jgi:catechol 2,3-dioxygenase-like lactoylglutathione lyase family enzyme
MIDGVSGIIIWTGNLNRMVEFYRDILGFPVHSERPNFVAFEWGDMRLSIGTHSEVSGPIREPHRIMINFATGDIHNVYETLTEKGVRFIRPPEREHWGGWVATFYDPDGNILQLLEQPD